LYTNIILQRSSEKFENNCVLEILDWLIKEERLIEILNGLDVEIPWDGKVGCSTLMLRAAGGLKAAQSQLRFLHIMGELRSHQYHWSSNWCSSKKN
jgi:hypothetical protein